MFSVELWTERDLLTYKIAFNYSNTMAVGRDVIFWRCGCQISHCINSLNYDSQTENSAAGACRSAS